MPSTVNQAGLNTCIIQDKGDPYIEDETELVLVINQLVFPEALKHHAISDIVTRVKQGCANSYLLIVLISYS